MPGRVCKKSHSMHSSGRRYESEEWTLNLSLSSGRLTAFLHVLIQAEEFLKAHSTNASVPSAPLSMVQASAAALSGDMERAASACLSEPCSRCASPPMGRGGSCCLPDEAGVRQAPSLGI